MAAEGVAHREQGFAQGRAFAEHLPGGDHAARGHGVVIAKLPAVEAALFAQLVDEAFHSEIRLVDPEPPERARRKVIREYRLHMHVHGGDVIDAGGMGAGAGDDRPPAEAYAPVSAMIRTLAACRIPFSSQPMT